MANRRFIDFPIASTVGDSDIILIWQSGANKQTTKATFLSGLPENLDELNDVAISGLTNGQILRYDSVTGKWENTDQGNLDLNDLNDVSIVSPSNGQVLVYNSSTSKWENSSGGYVPYTGAVTTVNLGAQTIQAGQFVKAGGTSTQFLKADGSVDSNTYGTGTVTSVALTMPSAFNVANSPITTAGTLAVTGAGTVGQYIRGDGSLADFPQASGGGSSVNYYLNGSISQGTIGGVAYKELNKVPILGAGTDFTINANGYIASFLTDAGDPNLLEIPGGNWNFETYFSASSSGGTPTFYVELYKYDGTTFTLIASSSSSPELIAFGTNLNPYFSTLAVPTTTLALTDRLAVRFYVTHSGRTITLHTENNHLCQVVTTFTTGLTSLNGLTAQVQNLAVGTSGTDFNIASATATHTFNLPTASATNRGALSSADWTTFNNKQNALGYVPVPETRTITINGVSQDLSANRTYNVGTVTSVGLSSATSGVTIGSTPVTTSGTITLAIATASGSQNGLLSSTDWTTFNSKQNALTNPVTGTGTTNYLPKFTGSTTIGNSATQTDATGNLMVGSANAGNAGTINVSVGVAGATAGGIQLWAATNQTHYIQFGDGTTGAQVYAGYLGYAHSTDSLLFGTNGADKMTLFSTGNLLVGTGSDNGARLQVSGTSTFSSFITAQSSGGSGLRIYGGSGTNQWDMYLNGANIRFSDNTGTGSFVVDRPATFSSSVTATNVILSATGYLGFGGGTNYIEGDNNNNIVRIGTNNVPRLTINGSGNVGIGTSTIGSERLTVVQTTGNASGLYVYTSGVATGQSYAATIQGGTNSSDASFRVFNQSGSTNYFTVRGDGNVGIGTTSPSYLLDLWSFNPILRIRNITAPATGGTSSLLFEGINNFSGVSQSFINSIQAGNSGATQLVFGTSGIFDATATERMRITSGGNVWVGNDSNPLLEIANGGSTDVLSGIRWSVGGSRVDYGGIYSATSSANNNYISFYTKNSASAPSERMRITSSGNVLIGTTTDSGENLQVKNGRSLFQLPSGTNGAILKLGRSAGAYYWHLGINGATSNFEFYDNGLNVLSNINVTTGAYTAVSDINKKKDFEDSTIGLNAILGLKPTLYRMKSESNTQKHLGFIAQEVKEYIPQAYMQNGDFIGLNEMPIIAALTKAIQELKQEIDTLKN